MKSVNTCLSYFKLNSKYFLHIMQTLPVHKHKFVSLKHQIKSNQNHTFPIREQQLEWSESTQTDQVWTIQGPKPPFRSLLLPLH